MDTAHAPQGRLLVCPTPIGNLQDVTVRVLEALAEADVIACEDVHRTGLLLKRYGLRRAEALLLTLHQHNERARVQDVLKRIVSGQTVVLVSDSGTPLICDPGFPLINAAIDRGLPVEVLPGPSAAMTALVASGLPAERFRFEGFLPRARGELARVLSQPGATLVAFESPKRVAATLEVLAEIDPQRRLALCRELTKLHEEVIRGTAAELAARLAGAQVRGEVALVIEGARPDAREELVGALDAVSELVQAGARPRVAARTVAKLTGVSANELYELAVAGAPAAAPGGSSCGAGQGAR